MLIEVRRDETDRWIGTGLNNNQLLTLNMGDLNIENAFKVIQFHIICKIKSKYSFIKLSINDKISWPVSVVKKFHVIESPGTFQWNSL